MKLLCFLALFGFALCSYAAEPLPDVLKDIGIDPLMGAQVPLQAQFINEQGKAVRLQDFFDGHTPVVLIMSYYECPMLCGIVLNAARDSFAELDWTPGKQYRVVTISIDPREPFTLAAQKKKNLIGSMANAAKQADFMAQWNFLVGKEVDIKAVADAIGFRYKWIPEEKQFAHGAAIFLLSPQGKLSRVLFGTTYPARNLKLGLLEASAGKVGTIAEKFLLFCYHYDPKDNQYLLFASRLMRVAGAVTVAAILGLYLYLFLRRRPNRGIV